jgi:hypothetical protein
MDVGWWYQKIPPADFRTTTRQLSLLCYHLLFSVGN